MDEGWEDETNNNMPDSWGQVVSARLSVLVYSQIGIRININIWQFCEFLAFSPRVVTLGVDVCPEEGARGHLPECLLPGHSAGLDSSLDCSDVTLVSAGAVGRRDHQQDQGPLCLPAGKVVAHVHRP